MALSIADQRTTHRVPHTINCTLLGVSLAWFYESFDRASGPAASVRGTGRTTFQSDLFLVPSPTSVDPLRPNLAEGRFYVVG